MAGLPRSEISFRRSGSSGLVWDDKLISGELNRVKPKSEEQEIVKVEPQSYKTLKVEPTLIDPPSPKVSGCGFCGGMFGKPVHKPKSGKRRRS